MPLKSLAKILDASLEEVRDWHTLRVSRETLGGFYVSALRYYMENNPLLLGRTISRFEAAFAESPERELVITILRARLAIRENKVTENVIDSLGKALPKAGDWEGEALFVKALCHEIRDEKPLMSRCYLESHKALEHLGAKKKSVLALLNHVASESQIHAGRKFLPEYEYVYTKAKRVKDHHAAGLALLNMSHDYADLNALQLALSHVNRSIALLERERQSRTFFLAVAHRAYVLALLGRKEEGRLDYEAFFASNFAELKGVRQVLEKHYQATIAASPEQMPHAWSTRSDSLRIDKLGALEQRLLKFVAEAPREKGELIEYLYGTKLSWAVLETRFKNTLARLKKKCPGAIVWEKGRYRLSEKVFSNLGKKRTA